MICLHCRICLSLFLLFDHKKGRKTKDQVFVFSVLVVMCLSENTGYIWVIYNLLKLEHFFVCNVYIKMLSKNTSYLLEIVMNAVVPFKIRFIQGRRLTMSYIHILSHILHLILISCFLAFVTGYYYLVYSLNRSLYNVSWLIKQE